MNLKNRFNGDAAKEVCDRWGQAFVSTMRKASEQWKTKTAGLKREDSQAKLIEQFRSVERLTIEKWNLVSKNVRLGIGAGVLGVIVLGTVLVMNTGTGVYQITIAGQESGYVAEEAMVEEVLLAITEEMTVLAPEAELVIDRDALVCVPTELKAKTVEFLSEEELKTQILQADLCKAKAWGIYINGNVVVATASEQDAEAAVDLVLKSYTAADAEVIDATFKEDVKVEEAVVGFSDLMVPDSAVSLILTGTKEPKTYTVQSGDTLWDIAKANQMSPGELEQANPGFDPAKLKIGQELNLYEVKPYVTVQTKEVVATTENIDFGIVYETSDVLYKGETKVKTAGVYGVKEIRSEVTKENGIIVGTQALEEVVVSEPQQQIALQGTKSIATFTGSGTFSSPLAKIEVSSAFGSRGGGRHTGVDLRNPKGTPIKAADDGVVTFAAYSGTYGNIVKVSHGDGLETWYAHCDTIGTSVGQVVKKGEIIATVGITGRATGYHLHFEVRKNGVPQNPMNYL